MSDTPETTNTPNAPVEPTPAAPAPAKPSSVNGLAIASLVTGILAFLCGLFFMGLIFGIAAIVLAAIALKKPNGKGFAIAGLVTGIVGAISGLIFTVIWVIALVTVGVGGAAVTNELNKVNNAIDAQNKETQDQIDAKKDFLKGETAKFGEFEVKVNSVTRNYTPDNVYQQADDGNELIVVNVTVKNVSDEAESFYSYDLDINEAGVANGSSYLDVEPAFEGGSISAGASATGNIVFEVTKDVSGLKLQHEAIVYDTKSYESKTLTYTLAI